MKVTVYRHRFCVDQQDGRPAWTCYSPSEGVRVEGVSIRVDWTEDPTRLAVHLVRDGVVRHVTVEEGASLQVEPLFETRLVPDAAAGDAGIRLFGMRSEEEEHEEPLAIGEHLRALVERVFEACTEAERTAIVAAVTLTYALAVALTWGRPLSMAVLLLSSTLLLLVTRLLWGKVGLPIRHLRALLALQARMEQETPWLVPLGVVQGTHQPLLVVKDTHLGDLCTAFGSEQDYDLYCALFHHDASEEEEHAPEA